MSDIEQTLQHQLCLLTAALDDCLKQAAPGGGDENGWRREAELAHARKLARVSALLAEALARLKGETRHSIQVSRGDVARGQVTRAGDKGGGA
jgi:hypothetical protein